MKVIENAWGREEILVQTDGYSLKRIYIKEEEQTPLKYHKVKKKTLFLEKGFADLVVNGTKWLMHKDKPYTINSEDVHRLIAYKDSVILEVSTCEVEDDYYHNV